MSIDKKIFYLIIFSAVLFLAGHLFGPTLFENDWSFSHYSYIPIWYFLAVAVLTAILAIIFFKKPDTFKIFFENKKAAWAGFLILGLIFYFSGSDSFIYNGGNYFIRDNGQSGSIIFRSYSLGFTFLGALFHYIFKLFTADNTLASFLSLKTLSILGMFSTLIASYLITNKITEQIGKKTVLFLLLLFGPSALLLFGQLGYHIISVSLIYWFVYLVLKLNENHSSSNLLKLWVLTLLAVLFHVSSLILVPALIFMTFRAFFKKNILFPLILSLTTLAILLIGTYKAASDSLEFSQYILQTNGPDFSRAYNLFSLKHIGDYFQIVFLAFPLVLVSKVLFFSELKSFKKNNIYPTLLLLVIAGNITLFILEPLHSIFLDFPAFTLYLAPAGLMLVFYLNNLKESNSLKLATLIAVIIPVSVLPFYTNIDIANSFAKDYLKKNQIYYMEVGTALQDSYFFKEDFDKANYWYTGLPDFSSDYLDFVAAGELAHGQYYSESVKKLFALKTKYPFWGEPRYLLAQTQLTRQQFSIAKAEIDTLLMLNPYHIDYNRLLYEYYRDNNNFPRGLVVLNDILEFAPDNKTILEDKAICLYRLQDYKQADSISRHLIEIDPSLAFPYLIQGFIAEINKDTTRAISNYKSFTRLAPDEPETPAIRKRLNSLVVSQMEDE